MTSSAIAKCYRKLRSTSELSHFLSLETDQLCYCALIMGAEISSQPGTITIQWCPFSKSWRDWSVRSSDARTSIKFPKYFGKNWILFGHLTTAYQIDYSYSMNAMLASVFKLPKNEIAIWNLQPLIEENLGLIEIYAPSLQIGELNMECEKLYLSSAQRLQASQTPMSISPIHLTTEANHTDRIFISDYIFVEVPLDYPIHLLYTELCVNDKEILTLNTANAIYLHSTKQAEVWAIPWLSDDADTCAGADYVDSFLKETFEWFETMEGPRLFTQIYGDIFIIQELDPGVKFSMFIINHSFYCDKLSNTTTPLESSRVVLDCHIEIWNT